MTKLPLFTSKKEIFYTLVFVVILFALSLSYEFFKYDKLRVYSLHVSTVKVLNSYTKVDKEAKKYNVLKLRSDDFTFYTINRNTPEIKIGDILRVIFYTNGISFYNYFKGFYANSKQIEILNKHKDSFVKTYIKNQHSYQITKELYNALFFATPISQNLRDDITKWGIAHLVAISGFHLGILSAILYFLIKPFYKFFQNRYFPYRNSFADLAFLVFVILGLYVYLISFTPSILRAYTMSIIGFLFFSRGIKILSFVTLFFTIILVLIFFPQLVFSIAFWLSVSGVFYIFLFLHYFYGLNKIILFVLLNFWVFICMLPISHYFFSTFSFYHFLSPIISMCFVVFYPLSLLLHVSGFGGVLDGFLMWFLSLHVETMSLVTPLWFLATFVCLSLSAIRLKFLVYFLPIFSLCIFFIQ